MVRQKDIEDAEKDKSESKTVKGMVWERSCTDCLFLLIFWAAMIIMFAVGIAGFVKGNPMTLVTPFDSVGNQCGQPNQSSQLLDPKPVAAYNGRDFTNYPVKYFVNLLSQDLKTMTYAVCAQKCPLTGEKVIFLPNELIPDFNLKQNVSIYPTDTAVVTSYCTPQINAQDFQNLTRQFYEQIQAQSGAAVYFLDLKNGWKPIAIMSGGSVGVAVIYIWLLKYITKPLLYISILLIQAALVALGGLCFQQSMIPDITAENKQYAQIAAGCIWALAALYLCFICCCWRNIAIGASIMECASEFVSENLRIVFLPLIVYAIAVVYFIFWLLAVVWLYSVGTAQFQQNSFIANIDWQYDIEYALWYQLFALLWAVTFIICLQQFMIACMACMWYFTGQGSDQQDTSQGSVSMIKAFCWGIWYHQGSIAFGSFLIALITFIRIVFEYMAKKYEAMGNKDSTVYKVVSCMIRCFLWCLDKYIRFITKNAYIQIALTSTNFCSAAMSSFFLIVRHAGRFSSAGMVGWILMILGKATIMSVSGLLTYIIARYGYPAVQQPVIPAICVVLVSYLVGSLFLSIFSFSSTAILHCFLLDEDTGGSKFSPKSLQGFLDLSDEIVKRKTEKEAAKETNK